MCQLSCRQVVMSSCWHLQLYKLFDSALLYLRPDGDVVDEVVVVPVPGGHSLHVLPGLLVDHSHWNIVCCICIRKDAICQSGE